ncbi:hypothetical protein WDU94_000216 [Cyamophila willieti]
MKLILSAIFVIFGVLLWCGSPVHGACGEVPGFKGLLCINGDDKSCTGDVFNEIKGKCKLEPGYTASCTICQVCKTGLYKDCCEIKKGNTSLFYTNNGASDVIIMPQ